MRYLVKAKVKSGQEKPLLQAIESSTLGRGSVAGDEYLDDMQMARIAENGVCTWVGAARAVKMLVPRPA